MAVWHVQEGTVEDCLPQSSTPHGELWLPLGLHAAACHSHAFSKTFTCVSCSNRMIML